MKENPNYPSASFERNSKNGRSEATESRNRPAEVAAGHWYRGGCPNTKKMTMLVRILALLFELSNGIRAKRGLWEKVFSRYNRDFPERRLSLTIRPDGERLSRQ